MFIETNAMDSKDIFTFFLNYVKHMIWYLHLKVLLTDLAPRTWLNQNEQRRAEQRNMLKVNEEKHLHRVGSDVPVNIVFITFVC